MGRQTAGLQLGNAVKSRRAQIKRAIAAGQIDVPALLEGAGDEEVEREALGMKVADLVSAIDGIGDVTVLKVLIQSEIIIASQRLADLTTERRRRLAAEIRKETQK